MVDVPRRGFTVARGPESLRQVIAFTNVLKLVSNRKSIDAWARRYISNPKPTEGSRPYRLDRTPGDNGCLYSVIPKNICIGPNFLNETEQVSPELALRHDQMYTKFTWSATVRFRTISRHRNSDERHTATVGSAVQCAFPMTNLWSRTTAGRLGSSPQPWVYGRTAGFIQNDSEIC